MQLQNVIMQPGGWPLLTIIHSNGPTPTFPFSLTRESDRKDQLFWPENQENLVSDPKNAILGRFLDVASVPRHDLPRRQPQDDPRGHRILAHRPAPGACDRPGPPHPPTTP